MLSIAENIIFLPPVFEILLLGFIVAWLTLDKRRVIKKNFHLINIENISYIYNNNDKKKLNKIKIKIRNTQMINNNLIFNIINILLNLIDVLLVLLPVLLSVAFMTIVERKQLAAHQRRVGPNTVGYYGVLQPLTFEWHFNYN